MTSRTVVDLIALAAAVVALAVALWLLDRRVDAVPVEPAIHGTVSPAPSPGGGS